MGVLPRNYNLLRTRLSREVPGHRERFLVNDGRGNLHHMACLRPVWAKSRLEEERACMELVDTLSLLLSKYVKYGANIMQ